jgi:hypothetical protein
MKLTFYKEITRSYDCLIIRLFLSCLTNSEVEGNERKNIFLFYLVLVTRERKVYFSGRRDVIHNLRHDSKPVSRDVVQEKG